MVLVRTPARLHACKPSFLSFRMMVFSCIYQQRKRRTRTVKILGGDDGKEPSQQQKKQAVKPCFHAILSIHFISLARIERSSHTTLTRGAVQQNARKEFVETMSGKKDDSMRCIMEGLVCVQTSCDCNEWKCCGARVCECLCIRESCCLALGATPRSCGICVQDANQGECCKIGLYCWDCAIIRPRLCCGIASQVWCLHEVGSLPLHKDYLDRPVCSLYFLTCCPECGCCVTPPASPALLALFGESSAMTTAVLPNTIERGYADDGEGDGGAEMVGKAAYRDHDDDII